MLQARRHFEFVGVPNIRRARVGLPPVQRFGRHPGDLFETNVRRRKVNAYISKSK